MKRKVSDEQGSDFPAGLAAPARRALAGAGISNLKQLTKFTESDIKELHGIGPNALSKLHSALAVQGLSFAQGKSKKSEKI